MKTKSTDEILGGVLDNLSHLQNLISSIQKLTETYNALKDKVENLEDELAQKRLELVEKESWANLGKLAAFIAHEIRSPLNAILLYIERLKELVKNSNELYCLIYNTENAANNICNFINDLLTLGKDFKLVKGYIQLEDFLKSLQSKINAYVDVNDNVSIKFDRKENFLMYVDRKYFEQAIFNLVKNAVEAVREKGEVNLLVYRVDNNCCFEISDTGEGIPDDIKKTLFTPFFTSKKNGVGLGLAFTKKIINAHNGVIELKYTGAKGTCFKIVIPLNDSQSVDLLIGKT